MNVNAWTGIALEPDMLQRGVGCWKTPHMVWARSPSSSQVKSVLEESSWYRFLPVIGVRARISRAVRGRVCGNKSGNTEAKPSSLNGMKAFLFLL